jgi:hypothetical protein
MRILNEFIIPKEEDIQETEASTNENGEEISTTKTVKKTVDKKFVVRKPSRALYDEAELFYGVKLAEGIKAGLLTRALLAKRFNNDGGVLSDPEKDKFSKLYMSLFEKQARVTTIEDKPKRERSKEEETELQITIEELNASREQIQEFEMSQASLFDQTAENRARNKTILWWVLNLAYEKDGDDHKGVFEGEDYNSKIDSYDRYEEKEDDFIDEMLKKFSYVVSFWFITKADTKEELDILLKTSEDEDKEEEAAEAEAVEGEAKDESSREPEEDPGKKPLAKRKKKKSQAGEPAEKLKENSGENNTPE